jgi:hypothetical protein
MTDEEKDSAAAYLKLHDDVKQLIIDTVYKELQNYSSLMHMNVKANVIYSNELEQKIKDVIKNQMMK